MLDFTKADFLISCPSIAQCPPDEGIEVAFCGRSNAGKSSAINTLTQNNKLARTSKTPGRTQLINHFSLSETQRLVDLPGYGFAKVPIELKKRWEKNLTEYLNQRRSLHGLILLMDIRHPLREFDTNILNGAVLREMPVHILLTKSDKLKPGVAKSTLLKVCAHLRDSNVDDLVSAQLFSSLKKSGLKELVAQLNQWFATAPEAAKEQD